MEYLTAIALSFVLVLIPQTRYQRCGSIALVLLGWGIYMAHRLYTTGPII